MILDTNALSSFFAGDPGLVKLLFEARELFLPVIVLGEYGFGLRGSKLRKEWEPKLNEFAKLCTVLPILETMTTSYASTRHDLKQADTPIRENDVWICALAQEYQLPIITRDAHFESVRQVKSIRW